MMDGNKMSDDEMLGALVAPYGANAARALIAAAVAESAPAGGLTDAEISDVFLANGFTVKPGRAGLAQYVIDAARALIIAHEAGRLSAGAATALAGESELIDGCWYWVRVVTGFNSTLEAAAMYLEKVECFYSYKFSGIPRRHVVVVWPVLPPAPAGDVAMPVVWFEDEFDAREVLGVGKKVVWQSDALAALAVKDAEIARLADEDEINTNIIGKMSKILAGIALALKGEELPLHRHGYADLVELTQKNTLELELHRHVEVERKAALAAQAAEIARLTADLAAVRILLESAQGEAALERKTARGLAHLVDSLNAQVAASEAAPVFVNAGPLTKQEIHLALDAAGVAPHSMTLEQEIKIVRAIEAYSAARHGDKMKAEHDNY